MADWPASVRAGGQWLILDVASTEGRGHYGTSGAIGNARRRRAASHGKRAKCAFGINYVTLFTASTPATVLKVHNEMS